MWRVPAVLRFATGAERRVTLAARGADWADAQVAGAAAAFDEAVRLCATDAAVGHPIAAGADACPWGCCTLRRGVPPEARGWAA